MGRVKCKIRWLKKYLKKTGRLKTLDVLNEDLKRKITKDEQKSRELSAKINKKTERKIEEDRSKKKKEKKVEPSLNEDRNKDERTPVKLSFAIQKAPERKKTEVVPPKPKKKEQTKDVEERKTVEVPKDFKKIAKKFGLPEDHLEFFYEHRESFNWEMKKEFLVHCTEPGCKLTVKEVKGCLNEHMVSAHDYTDIPCGKTDCSYIAYSQKNLNLHRSRFHGHGQKQSKDASHSCPYPSCKNAFATASYLQYHVNTHQNVVFYCNFCPYRAVQYSKLTLHLKLHFNIRDFICDICSRSFPNISYLNNHLKYTHNTEDFYCEYCKFTCTKYHEFARHRKSCKERLKHSRIL